jgi:hypothetical protein
MQGDNNANPRLALLQRAHTKIDQLKQFEANI